MKLLWQPEAIEDLQNIRAYVSRDKPSAARALVATILTLAEDQLSRFPQAGRAGRVEGTRELVVPGTPYIVAYRVRSDVIDILAVHHAARRWPDSF